MMTTPPSVPWHIWQPFMLVLNWHGQAQPGQKLLLGTQLMEATTLSLSLELTDFSILKKRHLPMAGYRPSCPS